MKVTILTDNNVINNKFLSEHGFSAYISTGGKNILFDTGASDVFLKNAKTKNIDLSKVDYIVLSHGHDDHSGGIGCLLEKLKRTPKFISCTDIFTPRFDKDGEFGIPFSKEKIDNNFESIYSDEPYFLSEDIVFLGKIPRENDFEGRVNVGYNSITKVPDYALDDSALAIKKDDGIVVITGCSHSGILNICEYAKKILNTERIFSIIGGLHLKDSTKEHIEKTVKNLKNLNLDALYACHCTGPRAQEELKNGIPLKDTGAGLEIII